MNDRPHMTRREALRLAACLTVPATACGANGGGASTTDASSGTDALLDVAADATADAVGDVAPDTVTDVAPDAVRDGVADAATDAVVEARWATGGTAAMTGAAAYPDPFEGRADGETCSITCEMTLGPCHVESPERRDISDGWDGLPVRLALRVVDEACEPVAGAAVEVWHTNHHGSYSGAAAAMCNLGEEDRAAGYFRGYQITDANGRVDFDTCYPGWYPGRAVHVHFRVQTDGYDPDDRAPAAGTSQLYFPDDINGSVFGAEPLYRDAGAPDRTNVSDGIARRAEDLAPYTCDIARLDDGAMLASAQIVLQSSSREGCAI